MAEAVAALSLAANIIQVVDFGAKFLDRLSEFSQRTSPMLSVHQDTAASYTRHPRTARITSRSGEDEPKNYADADSRRGWVP